MQVTGERSGRTTVRNGKIVVPINFKRVEQAHFLKKEASESVMGADPNDKVYFFLRWDPATEGTTVYSIPTSFRLTYTLLQDTIMWDRIPISGS